MVTGRESYDWGRASGFPAFGFSLANSGDAVLLWQVTGDDTTLVDQYAYRAHEAAADRAIGRLPEGTGAWVLFDGLTLHRRHATAREWLSADPRWQQCVQHHAGALRQLGGGARTISLGFGRDVEPRGGSRAEDRGHHPLAEGARRQPHRRDARHPGRRSSR